MRAITVFVAHAELSSYCRLFGLFLITEPFDCAEIEVFIFCLWRCCGFGHSGGSKGARRPEVLPVRCVKMRDKCLNCRHASRLDESAAKASLICVLDSSLARFYLALMGLKGPT